MNPTLKSVTNTKLKIKEMLLSFKQLNCIQPLRSSLTLINDVSVLDHDKGSCFTCFKCVKFMYIILSSQNYYVIHEH